MAVDLGDPVGTPRVKRRLLVLRRLPHHSEHLARRGLVEADALVHEAHGLEHARDAQARELGREHGLAPRRRHEGLRGQVVHLVGAALLEQADERELVQEVRLSELQAMADVLQPLAIVLARSPDHAEDRVALLEKQFGEVGAVLSRDPRDECASAARCVHSEPFPSRVSR